MIETQPTPKPNNNIWLWLLKMVSGLLIVLLLTTHFIINHFSGTAGGGLLTHKEVVQMYTSPGYIFLEILFLVIVISHALIGFRSIILDLNLAHNVMRILDLIFVILGVGSAGYGIWLLFRVASLA